MESRFLRLIVVLFIINSVFLSMSLFFYISMIILFAFAILSKKHKYSTKQVDLIAVIGLDVIFIAELFITNSSLVQTQAVFIIVVSTVSFSVKYIHNKAEGYTKE